MSLRWAVLRCEAQAASLVARAVLPMAGSDVTVRLIGRRWSETERAERATPHPVLVPGPRSVHGAAASALTLFFFETECEGPRNGTI